MRALAISAGCAVYPDDGTTYEALLKTADHRMYRDKSSRRELIHSPGTCGSACAPALMH